MDFFALPDVFVRKLMRTMEIKDRQRMRLVCRDFAKLVAETHAGTFRLFSVNTWIYGKQLMSFHISGVRQELGWGARGVDTWNENPARPIRNWRRFFNGITFENFYLDCPYQAFTLPFLRDLLRNCTIVRFSFNNERCLEDMERSLELARGHPSSKISMKLTFVPPLDRLQSLPPMETLTVWPTNVTAAPQNRKDYPTITGDIFLNLLARHASVHLFYSTIGPEEIMRVIEILSADSRKRSANWMSSHAPILAFLKHRGLTSRIRAGERSGEGRYETIGNVLIQRRQCTITCVTRAVHLRFRNCFIRFDHFEWTGDAEVSVSIENGLGPLGTEYAHMI